MKKNAHELAQALTVDQMLWDCGLVCVCVCFQKAHRQLGPSCSMTKIASKLNMFNTWGCVSVRVFLGQRNSTVSMTSRVHSITEAAVLSNLLR